MNIDFVALDKDNWKACSELWSNADQFITSNLRSIAEAQFYPKAISRAIVVDGEMIGYSMYGEDEDDPGAWAIDRFMIAKPFRRSGYGSQAMNLIIEEGRTKGFKKFITSTEERNAAMRGLLSKIGFETDFEMREDEIVYLKREQNAQQGSADQPATAPQ